MTTLKAKHNKSNQNIYNVYYTAVLRRILNQWDCTVGGAIQRNKMFCSLRLDKTLCKGAFMVAVIYSDLSQQEQQQPVVMRCGRVLYVNE